MSNSIEVKHDFGYGLIPREIMRDKNISIQAKALYSYLASFAGNSGKAYPSVELMLSELGITRNTFYKYLKELKESNAVLVKKERTEQGTFERNIYYLQPCTNLPGMVKPDTAEPDMVNVDTNSNNTTSNNLNSSCSSNSVLEDENVKVVAKLLEENGFGTISGYVVDKINNFLDNYKSKWVIEAIEIAIEQNVRTLKYVEGILMNWKTKGKTNKERSRDNDFRGNVRKKDEGNQGTYDLTGFY